MSLYYIQDILFIKIPQFSLEMFYSYTLQCVCRSSSDGYPRYMRSAILLCREWLHSALLLMSIHLEFTVYLNQLVFYM